MLEAREQNAEDVKHDQDYSQIGQDLMDMLEPFRAPESIGGHHVSGDARASEHCK
jgi:hypothetical protein